MRQRANTATACARYFSASPVQEQRLALHAELQRDHPQLLEVMRLVEQVWGRGRPGATIWIQGKQRWPPA